MNSSKNILSDGNKISDWLRNVARAGAVIAMGLGFSLAAIAATPYNGAPAAGNVAAPYSWPQYHSGGGVNYDPATNGPTTGAQPTPAQSDPAYPFANPLVPYYQLQGTPSGFVDVLEGNPAVETPIATQIYSSILGNFSAGAPPNGLTGAAPNYNLGFFPNHFENGPDFSAHYTQIDGPLPFRPLKTAGAATPDVQGSPVAINYTEYNEIADMYYVGENVTSGQGTPGASHGTLPGAAPVPPASPTAIRQVVYFTRSESMPAIDSIIGGKTVETIGGVPVPSTDTIALGTLVPVSSIYAMDGFTGDIIWRYQLPFFSPSAHTLSESNTNTYFYDQAIYTSVAIAHMNVTLSDGTTADKLVVIAADDNGYVYCIDGVGNGVRDPAAESNTNVLYQSAAPGGYNYTTNAAQVGQVDYDDQVNEASTGAGYVQNNQPHIGTTFAYWIYRPDPANPLQGATGAKPGAIDAAPAADHTLPVPEAFGTASPTVIVNPSTGDGTVLIGNRNGVLYALAGTGGLVADTANEGAGLTNAYNLSVKGIAGIPDLLPTTNVEWWDSLSGINADTNIEAVEIESAPALSYSGTGDPTVYVGTSDPNGTSNGRLYAVDVTTGPKGDNGTGSATPGSANYNVTPIGLWQFPSTGAIGDISGSPVVFANPDNAKAIQIYFGADTGYETTTTGALNQPSRNTGRIWAVNADGSFDWAYPSVTVSGTGGVTEVTAPIEGFSLATPAIGMVQFPTITQYLTGTSTAPVVNTYTHVDGVHANVAGQFVPMLYIGSSSSAAGGNLYALDLDGTNDTQRGVYAYNGVGSAASFYGSPALVVNPSTAGGNGGSVFITQGGELRQYQATPISTNSVTTPYAAPRLDYSFPYGGPTSSPAVAAAAVSDLTTGTTSTETVTDWVYVGDSATGQCFGFTPLGYGNDTTGIYLPGVVTPPAPTNYNAPPVVNQFPMRAYIYNPASTSPYTNIDQSSFTYARDSKTGQAASPLPVFEWGNTIYFRFANVVPPLLPNSANPASLIKDPTGSGNYLGNGASITFTTTEVNNAGVNIPNTMDTFTIPNVSTATPLTANGFIERTDTGTTAANFGHSSELDSTGASRAPSTELLDNNGFGWIACGAYSVGFPSVTDPQGATRHNTPGAARRIVSAIQTVTRYTLQGGVYTPVATNPTFQINLTATPAYNYSQPTGASAATNDTATKGTLYIDEPTFGILNPLAVRGAGDNLTTTPGGLPPVGPGWLDAGTQEGIGPFEGISASTFSTGESPINMEALANGDMVDTNPPPSGVLALSPNPTNPTANVQNAATVLQPYERYIITTTGEIPDGTAGDNANVTDTTQAPPAQGTLTNSGTSPSGVPSGLTDPAGYGPYNLDVADRSLLGINAPGTPLTVNISNNTLDWQDNYALSGTTYLINPGTGFTPGVDGPNSRINPLPWESTPVVNNSSSDNSVDYPDIPPSAVTYGLAPNTAIPSATPNGATPANRIINPDSVSININVPRYQPANLDLWRQSPGSGVTGPTTPTVPDPTTHQPTGIGNVNQANYNYPMGYFSEVNIAASTSGFVNPNDPNAAHRTVWVFTGVPVDFSTSITNAVTDVGVVPAGFGEQMNAFTPPGTTTALGAFTPYNAYFQSHFQPLNIVNSGNVNLINPHLDQLINTNSGFYNDSPLPLLSDSLDSSVGNTNSFIPGFDTTGIAGPPGTLPNGLAAAPFLIRSTIDTDLAESYGRSPLILGSPNAAAYPVATFHKPLVNDITGTTMSVPDVPHGFGFATTPPVLNAGVAAPTLPYVGVEVPYGTPIGTYSQNLRLFEGYDPNYNNLIGPTYGGVPGGYGPFTPTTSSSPSNLSTFDLTYSNGTSGAPHGLQPYSNPATQLKVSVEEQQMTNGFTQGALPMIDVAAVGNPNAKTKLAQGAANFLPFAYRDPNSGNLNLYWTTSRNYVAGTTLQYNIAGANMLYNSGGYFQPVAGGSQWWSPISSFPFTPTTPPVNHVGWSVALTQAPLGSGFGPDTAATGGFGFDTLIGSQAPYLAGINCYTVTPATGVASRIAVVASSSQPKEDVRGLSFTGVTFNDPNGGASITNNLWAFWTGGARGHTALYYSPAIGQGSSTRFGTDINGTGQTGLFAALPIPAGIVDVSHPEPVITTGPLPTSGTGQSMPVIEVTYSGVGGNGAADLYLSRYQPYRPLVNGAADSGGNPNSQILLGLVPFPQTTEQLQPNPGSLWWQAKDVGWVRNNDLGIELSLTENNVTYTTTVQEQNNPSAFTGTFGVSGGSGTPFTGQIVYDRASGLLVFTNVTLPRANGNSVTFVPGQTIYVDPANGRIRFSIPPPIASPSGAGTTAAYSNVTALFSATARRITTSPSGDTEPVAFLDDAYAPNESGVSADPNIQADRYWFVWRRAGTGGAGPTLWYKTQRLTTPIINSSGQPVGIAIVNGVPQVTVTLVPSGTTLYAPGGAGSNIVDVDATRGRLYFPITYSNTALEGQTVTITGMDSTGAPIKETAIVQWLDEPLFNTPTGQAATGPQAAAASDGYQIPMNASVNESGPSAFLDPAVYANTPSSITFPHKVWLFWTSVRNGVPDIYNETLNPRFAAVTNAGSP